MKAPETLPRRRSGMRFRRAPSALRTSRGVRLRIAASPARDARPAAQAGPEDVTAADDIDPAELEASRAQD